MSLDWSIKRCKISADILNGDTVAVIDSNGISYTEEFVTTFVTFECMAVDLNGVTEKNVDEFLCRSRFWRSLPQDIPLTPDGGFRLERRMLVRRIGLVTNVASKSWATFCKRQTDYSRRLLLRQIGREAAFDREIEAAVNADK